MTRTRQDRRTPLAAADARDDGDSFAPLTRIAFFLAIALVLSRATMLETARDPFDISPASPNIPRGPGATAGLVLDLLCCLPALLVLLRRAIDKTYVVRWSWSILPVGLLGIWAVASTFWSSDKFMTAVTAAHLLSAVALLWAASQLVRSWKRLRIVAAACFALLLVMVAHGIIYRFVELPDLKQSWQEHRQEILKDRGWEEDSFHARRFARKIEAGEMVGFSASPNTYAAGLVLLAVVSAGIGIHRLVHRDGAGWIALIVGAVALAGWMILYTHSRAALLSPVLAGMMLLGVWLGGRRLAAHARLAYWIVLLAVAIGAAAIVAHGIHHGTLFHDSLNFRWRYWVGSFRLFIEHPLLGVGWGNFGPHYLSVRLPVASEEIKDPHNFLVKSFVELGMIGGALMLAWVARLWWELTRPIQPTAAAAARPAFAPPTRSPLPALAMLAAGAMLLNALASIDWSQIFDYLLIEVLRRGMYFCLLFAGLVGAALQSMQKQEVDDRAAPWVLHAMLAALGVFFIHNLIDFSMFETGTMFVMALVAGSVLGVRLPPVAGRRKRTAVAVTALAVAAVAWLTAGAVFVLPVAQAEARAQRADEAIRAGRVAQAASLLEEAFYGLDYNADYALRAARARVMQGASPDQVRAMLAFAVARNPQAVEYHLIRARFELAQQQPDAQIVQRHFNRAVALNPNEVSIRLDYAAAMESLGMKAEAADQYTQALWFNGQLAPDEPKRLDEQKVKEIEGKIRLRP